MRDFEGYKIQKSETLQEHSLKKAHHHKPRNYSELYIQGFWGRWGTHRASWAAEGIEPEAPTAQSGLSVSDLIPDEYFTRHFHVEMR